MATDNDAPGSNTCEPLEETTLQQEATSGQEAAQKLAAEYRPTMDLDVLHSWAKDAAAALAAAQTTLEASEQARLQAKNLVKKLRQQAAQEATEAIQANQQNQWDVRKFCQGMESGLLSAASQLEQALGTGQTPEPGRTQNTETSETAQRDRLQGRLRKPMTDTPTTRPAGLPSTPEACRAEQGRVLQRLHGTTPGTWQAISGGYILAKAQSGNEWVCDGGFDSEADLSLAAASPNTHQAYAGLLAEHATLLERQAALAEMQGLLREMEWSGKQEGQPLGSMWHHTPGPLVPACPMCGGIKPGSSDDFVKKAYGHRPECRLGTFLHSTTQGDPL